jgi:hypothetical protein
MRTAKTINTITGAIIIIQMNTFFSGTFICCKNSCFLISKEKPIMLIRIKLGVTEYLLWYYWLQKYLKGKTFVTMLLYNIFGAFFGL